MDHKPANYKPAYRPTVDELLQRNKYHSLNPRVFIQTLVSRRV